MHPRYTLLDPLRLLAVLAVLLFHYAFRGAAADGLTHLSIAQWRPVARYGYLGVELFFVISGFVIALSAKGRSATEFAIARAIRIYPAFVICMTVSFVVLLLFGAPVFVTGFGQWAANLVILAPALHQRFMDGVYWSIIYEVIFYGWVTLALANRKHEQHLLAVLLCWIALSVANELIGPSIPVRRLFLTDVSGFFLSGIMIYKLRATTSTTVQWIVLLLSIELAIGQSIIVSQYQQLHFAPDLSKAAVAATAFVSIGLVALCTAVERSPIPPRIALVVGGMTYPLYLLHQNIGFVVFNLFDRQVPPECLVVATTLGLIAFSHVICLVERPVQEKLRRLIVPRRVPQPSRAIDASPPRVASGSGLHRATDSPCR